MHQKKFAWRPLGSLLVEKGLLTEEELAEALAEQPRTGRRLGEILVERGYVSSPAVARALAEQYGAELEVEQGFGTGLRAEIERRHRTHRHHHTVVDAPPAPGAEDADLVSDNGSAPESGPRVEAWTAWAWAAVERRLRQRPTLQRPGNGRYPDRFYCEVARVCLDAARRDIHPAKSVAEEAAVPRGTAARWIAEARRKGYLPAQKDSRLGGEAELELRYLGPHEVVVVPLPDAPGLWVRRGKTLELPIDFALALLEHEESWRPAGRR